MHKANVFSMLFPINNSQLSRGICWLKVFLFPHTMYENELSTLRLFTGCSRSFEQFVKLGFNLFSWGTLWALHGELDEFAYSSSFCFFQFSGLLFKHNNKAETFLLQSNCRCSGTRLGVKILSPINCTRGRQRMTKSVRKKEGDGEENRDSNRAEKKWNVKLTLGNNENSL